MNKMNPFIWNDYIQPHVFENEWNKVIREFHFEEHHWLNHLFEIRHMWIPAYFRDVYLSGLIRTTSRSESENSFFTSGMNPYITLVEFYMRFEHSLDAQRHQQSKKDYDSEHKLPECKTPIGIEQHAATIFTIPVFFEFQNEVQLGCYCCGIVALNEEFGTQVYSVNEVNVTEIFKVVFDGNSKKTSCECKAFEIKGIPCRHMVCVWKLNLLEKIPEQYILSRWCKNHVAIHGDVDGVLGDQSVSYLGKKLKLNRMWAAIFECAAVAQRSEAHIDNLTRVLLELTDSMMNTVIASKDGSSSSKVQEIEMLIGSRVPDEVTIKAPKMSKNKGTGIHIKSSRIDKRLKSEKEKAIEKHEKPKRICKSCNKPSHHDSRNCPLKSNV